MAAGSGRGVGAALVLLAACGPTAPPAATASAPPPGEARPASGWSEVPHEPREEAQPEMLCPRGARWEDGACVVQRVQCPAGSTLQGTTCVGSVTCPAGTSWNGASCAPPLSERPPEGACLLNINSIPSSAVILDGRSVGQTPVFRAPASAGVHTVIFVHTELGRKSVTVQCKEGQTKAVAVKLGS